MDNTLRLFISGIEESYNEIPNSEITIGDDLTIRLHTTEDCSQLEPKKIEKAVISVCTSGYCRVKVNLQEYELESPMLITLMPGQIIEPMETSANFQAYTIALSKRFLDMINIPGWQQKYLSMYNNPATPLNEEQLTATRFFFGILYRAAANSSNPFRLQVIENLIRVFYYGGISCNETPATHTAYKNSMVERFLELVHEHYRTERMIGFYADRIYVTPKYLSKVVKEHTGRSAGEWIESHVILDARAMLQSSDMTIQQIAASLNFPNQSFFGKYFKRATGLSPKEYRRTGGK
ncbi:MAG: AraC family transcriptional regulator [Alistipes sp.]|nr:AraC family transcriptional regulator [Alistipes sp.]